MQPEYDPSARNDASEQPDGCTELVASRRDALGLLRSATLAFPKQPVLITGEPGAGKTLVVCRFMGSAPAGWSSVSVDLGAGMNALEFLRLVGHPFGISPSGRLGKARIRLQVALADESAEGRRWVLVVNQAHRGRAAVWDEVQAIANQLGRPDGFAALFIVGATDLVRSLLSRRSAQSVAALSPRTCISNRSTLMKRASCSRRFLARV